MTNSDASHRAIKHYQSNLDKKWGDLETMIAGIWFRVTNDYALLNPTAIPRGYRGTRLRNFLIQDCGARRTTKWGATALRGDLKQTKKHIVEFYELVNAVPDDELAGILKACGLLYANKINAETPEIIIPPVSAVQQTLVSALQTTGTLGKVQQGLVYAVLLLERRILANDLTIITKATHAGDLQSGIKGDVILLDGRDIVAAYEVKGHQLTEPNMQRILETHGQHDYPLFVVATAFAPLLQDKLNSLENTFAIHLIDFMLSLLGQIQAVSRQGLAALIRELVEIYNDEFCEKIEQDTSIKISITDGM